MTTGKREGGRDVYLKGITTRTIGRRIEEMDNVPSTNIIARELAAKGCIDGTVVVAKAQTEGAGRMGRPFYSPLGGLYLSVVLRPNVQPELLSPLPLVFGLSVVKAIACTVSLVAELKWPNDVLIKGKKVCGILSLSSSSKEGTDHVIIGVGINANSRTGDLPPELSGTATTLRDEIGKEIDPDELLRNILYFMDLNYSAFMDGQIGELLEEWSLRSSTLRREVRVTTPSGTVEGTSLGVDNSGALMISTPGGLTRVLTGDCSYIERS